MKFSKLAISALSVIAVGQMLSASELGENNILQLQIKKNNEVVASESQLFLDKLELASGNRKGMLNYTCTKKDDKTTTAIRVEMYGIDNYNEIKCSKKINDTLDCELKVFNATNKDKEAIREYEAKSCKNISPEVSLKGYNFTLKKNATHNIELSDGIVFAYTFKEAK